MIRRRFHGEGAHANGTPSARWTARAFAALALAASLSGVACKRVAAATDAGAPAKSGVARAAVRFDAGATGAAGVTAAIASGATSAKGGAASGLGRWVTVGPGGAIIARAISATGICPTLHAGRATVAMRVRSPATLPAFPIHVCEATLPAGTTNARLSGEPLPMPVESPTRIAVLGDTGCRMKGRHFQKCRDPEAWPLAALIRTIAAWKPDLVVHVGDYHYRENACPPGNAICAGSPAGDNWDAWNVDFFVPAAPLLRAAPWVMVRGNHEICKRAGHGWFRILDPRARPESGCADFSEPYALPLGKERSLVVLDTTIAHDWKHKPKQIEAYSAQAKALVSLAEQPTFVATHKPIWSVVPKRGAPTVPLAQVQPMLLAGFGPTLPRSVELWMAGHLHFFQLAGFEAPRPASLVTGHGGTDLLPPVPSPIEGMTVDGKKITTGIGFSEHGFTTLTKVGDSWRIEARDVNGNVRASCKLTGTLLTCEPFVAKAKKPR